MSFYNFRNIQFQNYIQITIYIGFWFFKCKIIWSTGCRNCFSLWSSQNVIFYWLLFLLFLHQWPCVFKLMAWKKLWSLTKSSKIYFVEKFFDSRSVVFSLSLCLKEEHISEKPIKRPQSKFWGGADLSMVNGNKEPMLSFFKTGWIFSMKSFEKLRFQIINLKNSIFQNVALNVEDDEHKLVDFPWKTLTVALQVLKFCKILNSATCKLSIGEITWTDLYQKMKLRNGRAIF